MARLLGYQSHADVVHRVLGVHLADFPVGRWAFQAPCPIQSCQFHIQELVPPPERDLGRARQQMDVAIQRVLFTLLCPIHALMLLMLTSAAITSEASTWRAS